MSKKSITPEEKHNMLHALGLTVEEKPFRNHYMATPGGDDHKIWEGLRTRGLAFRKFKPSAEGLVIFYGVSEAGKELLGMSP